MKKSYEVIIRRYINNITLSTMWGIVSGHNSLLIESLNQCRNTSFCDL